MVFDVQRTWLEFEKGDVAESDVNEGFYFVGWFFCLVSQEIEAV